jgi:predicted transcriptional regulator of viral defense system
MYRISGLIQQDQKLFHTNDLAVLWGIANRHTLYVTISRYIDKGILFPVFKGLYATIPIASLDPLEVGKAVIHRYTYLSTESVLSMAGVISQAVFDHTFVADQSKRVMVGSWSFRYRQLKDEYLFNPSGVIDQNGVLIATAERAAADMLYFNPRYHLDVMRDLDLEKVRLIQEELGYPHVRSQA